MFPGRQSLAEALKGRMKRRKKIIKGKEANFKALNNLFPIRTPLNTALKMVKAICPKFEGE
jgi:hypothetical protein